MMRLIHALLEWFDTDAPHGINKALVVTVPLAHIDFEQPGDGLGHRVLRNRGTDDFAERRRSSRRATDGDLIPLLAVLIHAEDTDVADVMMAAGIHAARHLDLDRTEIVQIVQVVEARMYLLGHVDRSGIGEAAEVQTGTADYVGQRADICGREPERIELAPHYRQRRLRYVGQHQVLVVRGPYHAEAHAIGQLRKRLHLPGSHVAGGLAVLLQRHEYHAISGHLVAPRVVAQPGFVGRLAGGDTDSGGRAIVELLVRRRGEENGPAGDLLRVAAL